MGDGFKKIPKVVSGRQGESVGGSMREDRHAQLEPQRRRKKERGQKQQVTQLGVYTVAGHVLGVFITENHQSELFKKTLREKRKERKKEKN